MPDFVTSSQATLIDAVVSFLSKSGADRANYRIGTHDLDDKLIAGGICIRQEESPYKEGESAGAMDSKVSGALKGMAGKVGIKVRTANDAGKEALMIGDASLTPEKAEQYAAELDGLGSALGRHRASQVAASGAGASR